MAKRIEYKAEFGKKLIEFMSAGYTFKAFAGEVGCARATLYNWVNAHAEFSEAKDIATSKARLYWERLGIKNLENREFNTTLYIAIMNNMFWNRENAKLRLPKDKGITPSGDREQDLKTIAALVRDVGNE